MLALLSGRTVHVRKGLPCSPQAPAPDHSLHASTASSQPQPPLATFQTHADTDARLDILSEASSVEYTLAQGEGGKALGEQPLSPFVESVGSDGRSLKGMVDRDEPRNRRQAVRRNRGRTGRGGAEETAHNAVAAADGAYFNQGMCAWSHEHIYVPLWGTVHVLFGEFPESFAIRPF